MALRRVDSELVRRKLAASRTQAQEMIFAGRVWAGDQKVEKPARQIDSGAPLRVTEPITGQRDYVSRGAFKLLGALEALKDEGPQIEGTVCADIGASTGGFTEVLLERQAAKVFAIDVGYGQLSWKIRQNPRVVVMERTNARNLQAGDLTPMPELFVADLSFISLELIIPALCRVSPLAAQLLMVKPQFEVGKGKLGSGGVVRNLVDRQNAVQRIANCALENGLGILQVAASPLAGPAGNVEYFLWMRPQNQLANWLQGADLATAIKSAVQNGPRGAHK